MGYQCANYYRQMIEKGLIEDENYVLDEKGKAHFMRKGKRIVHHNKVSECSCALLR